MKTDNCIVTLPSGGFLIILCSVQCQDIEEEKNRIPFTGKANRIWTDREARKVTQEIAPRCWPAVKVFSVGRLQVVHMASNLK